MQIQQILTKEFLYYGNHIDDCGPGPDSGTVSDIN